MRTAAAHVVLPGARATELVSTLYGSSFFFGYGLVEGASFIRSLDLGGG